MGQLHTGILFHNFTTFHIYLPSRFNPRKGFYCVLANKGKDICLGKSKGRKYPPLSKEDQKYLEHYYAPHNRKLYKLLLQLSRRPPSWLVKGFSS